MPELLPRAPLTLQLALPLMRANASAGEADSTHRTPECAQPPPSRRPVLSPWSARAECRSTVGYDKCFRGAPCQRRSAGLYDPGLRLSKEVNCLDDDPACSRLPPRGVGSLVRHAPFAALPRQSPHGERALRGIPSGALRRIAWDCSAGVEPKGEGFVGVESVGWSGRKERERLRFRSKSSSSCRYAQRGLAVLERSLP